MREFRVFAVLSTALIFSCVAAGQTPNLVPADKEAANPQIKRLAYAFAGDWNTTETMGKSVLFPNGGGRRGVSHSELAAGGTLLVSRGHSDGSAGPLNYLIAIWWDNHAGVYRFFTCFNDPNEPCVVRGTAQWEGQTFVNDYEDMLNGKKMKFRDTFYDITPTSHRLVEAVDTGNGMMTPLIRTTSLRKADDARK